jgi:NADPH-dependent 2,4-dienoyl-CoA reductase/sulfur reductase-like enzyme
MTHVEMFLWNSAVNMTNQKITEIYDDRNAENLYRADPLRQGCIERPSIFANNVLFIVDMQ